MFFCVSFLSSGSWHGGCVGSSGHSGAVSSDKRSFRGTGATQPRRVSAVIVFSPADERGFSWFLRTYSPLCGQILGRSHIFILAGFMLLELATFLQQSRSSQMRPQQMDRTYSRFKVYGDPIDLWCVRFEIVLRGALGLGYPRFSVPITKKPRQQNLA